MKEILLTLSTLGSWKTLPTTISTRSRHSLDYINIGSGHLLLLGGLSSTEQYISNSFYSYNILTNTWTSRTYGFGAIAYHATSVINNKLYIHGGTDGVVAGGSTTLRSYDFNTNTWTTLANRATARWTHCMCVYNDNLYLYGGLASGGVRLKDFYIYSVTNNQWTRLADAPGAKNAASICALNDKIYVYGGFNTSYTNDVYEYDVSNNSWSVIDNLEYSLITPRLFPLVNDFLIFGSNSETKNVLLKYNPINKEVVKMNAGPSNRRYFGFCGFQNKVYVHGGTISTTVAYNDLNIFTT